MAETIGECVDKFSKPNLSDIEKTRQDFEKLKGALEGMIPHLDGFDELVENYNNIFRKENTPNYEIADSILRGKATGQEKVDGGIYYNLDLGSDINPAYNDFKNKNPGFNNLLFSYIELREDIENNTSVNDQTAQVLADCLAEVTQGQ